MVLHGEDGLDEITISDGTRISRFRGGKVETFYIVPEEFGFVRSDISAIVGGDKKRNAEITLAVLRGEKGPRRNTVLLNAAAALVVAGVTPSLAAARDFAAETLDSGKALRKLEEIQKATTSL
jgi:anthranilate phosphoribosyltransferase